MASSVIMDSIIGPDGGVHHHYDGGFIFLSYLISFVGCCTALELLNRRTGPRGRYNW